MYGMWLIVNALPHLCAEEFLVFRIGCHDSFGQSRTFAIEIFNLYTCEQADSAW